MYFVVSQRQARPYERMLPGTGLQNELPEGLPVIVAIESNAERSGVL